LLILLEDRHDRPTDRDARAIERVDRTRLAANLGPVADLRAPRLEIFEVRARRDLAIRVLTGQPHLEVVRLRRRKAQIAGAQRDDAIVQTETLQHALGVLAQRLELAVARFGLAELHELDLVELMLADQAARVATTGTGLGAEARRVRGEPDRQLAGLEDVIGVEVRDLHLRRRRQ